MKLLLILLTATSLVGCRPNIVTIEERPLPKQNPTSYEFGAPINQVQRAVAEARGQKWTDTQKPFEGGELLWKSDGAPIPTNIFNDPKNGNDAYLYGMGNAVGKSQVYLKNGKELTYYADFHIHISTLDPSKTRVEIFSRDCHVLAGTESHLFAQAGVFACVEPTSIEEYQILLDVGLQLGVVGMPNIIKPVLGSPTRKVSRPRRR